MLYLWALSRENLSSGCLTKRDSDQSPQLQRLARKLNFFFEVSLDMIVSNKRTTKALISLRGCAGWSASLMFTNPRRQVFSRRLEAHLIYNIAQIIWRC